MREWTQSLSNWQDDCATLEADTMNRRDFISTGSLFAAAAALPAAASNPSQKQLKEGEHMNQNSIVPLTSIHRVEADGVRVFYREAGPADAPVVLLLHGFPTSSFQFRELIPRLADRYHVIAPDLPGFGFTEVPSER